MCTLCAARLFWRPGRADSVSESESEEDEEDDDEEAPSARPFSSTRGPARPVWKKVGQPPKLI